MNTLGTKFRVSLIGESHGSGVGCVLDGVQAGLAICEADFKTDINRRKPGAKGTTTRIETDIPQLLTGVYNGFTTGAPLTIWFENENIKSQDYDFVKSTPRPGHADWVAAQKFNGFNDHRGSGHFSGRLTLPLVAAGVLAKKHLKEGVNLYATLIQAGGNTDIEASILQAIAINDSIGGIVECVIKNVPVGVGEPFWDTLEGCLAKGMMAIPAIRGVEFGLGFAAASMPGSKHNDAIINAQGHTATNNAGGIVGGISNGNDIVFRIAVKPTSSTPQVQETYNFTTQNLAPLTVKGRHDVCIALRVPVVVEAVAAMILVDLLKMQNI